MGRLEQANARVARLYPGETGLRQPVHTVYGGAHLFTADISRKLGAAALRTLDEYAPDPAAFASAFGFDRRLAETIYQRVRAKLEREPVEDFRIDFEDGYGNRTDAEEDGHAIAAAEQMAAGHGRPDACRRSSASASSRSRRSCASAASAPSTCSLARWYEKLAAACRQILWSRCPR